MHNSLGELTKPTISKHVAINLYPKADGYNIEKIMAPAQFFGGLSNAFIHSTPGYEGIYFDPQGEIRKRVADEVKKPRSLLVTFHDLLPEEFLNYLLTREAPTIAILRSNEHRSIMIQDLFSNIMAHQLIRGFIVGGKEEQRPYSWWTNVEEMNPYPLGLAIGRMLATKTLWRPA